MKSIINFLQSYKDRRLRKFCVRQAARWGRSSIYNVIQGRNFDIPETRSLASEAASLYVFINAAGYYSRKELIDDD